MNDAALHNEIMVALQWYADNGVSDCLLEEPFDHTVPAETLVVMMPAAASIGRGAEHNAPSPFLGKIDAYDEAVKLAKAVNTLDELREAILGFDGIAIKKNASHMVFADGQPQAKIMIIGEAPAADDDRTGIPFSGESGKLLDKILACIGLSRSADELEKAAYLTNILNWRPPGNRPPNPAEIEISLPFIERHIQLVKPDILILFGSTVAKSLLNNTQSISRLRGSWHDYTCQTDALGAGGSSIPTLATYHPQQLLTTPLQKKSVWEDMLRLQAKIHK